MSVELKLALQALGVISEKDARVGNLKEVLRLFQNIQKITVDCVDLTCSVYVSDIYISFSLHFYDETGVDIIDGMLTSYNPDTCVSSYRFKKQFFSDLKSFIKNVRKYCYEKEGNDPTRACILP